MKFKKYTIHPLKILSIGDFSAYGISNTCLHRNWALKNIANEFYEVNTSNSKSSLLSKIIFKLFKYGLPLRLTDSNNINNRIKKIIKLNIHDPFDIVWIDKGLIVKSSTLKYIKNKSKATKIISYTADNMILRHNQSQNFLDCLPLYDIHFTTKSYIVNDLKKIGAKKVLFTNKHYEDSFHFPRILTEKEREELGGDVGFIGSWEEERCQSILFLVKNNIKVKVYGGEKWLNYRGVENLTILPAIHSEDYSKALQSFKISLCFLRKINKDQQTSRSMEIPACGGFMLAERTQEHLDLFEEGREADFFSDDKELLEKCLFYLQNEKKRIEIAKAGHLRCKKSGYSNKESLKRMIYLSINN